MCVLCPFCVQAIHLHAVELLLSTCDTSTLLRTSPPPHKREGAGSSGEGEEPTTKAADGEEHAAEAASAAASGCDDKQALAALVASSPDAADTADKGSSLIKKSDDDVKALLGLYECLFRVEDGHGQAHAAEGLTASNFRHAGSNGKAYAKAAVAQQDDPVQHGAMWHALLRLLALAAEASHGLPAATKSLSRKEKESMCKAAAKFLERAVQLGPGLASEAAGGNTGLGDALDQLVEEPWQVAAAYGHACRLDPAVANGAAWAKLASSTSSSSSSSSESASNTAQGVAEEGGEAVPAASGGGGSAGAWWGNRARLRRVLRGLAQARASRPTHGPTLQLLAPVTDRLTWVPPAVLVQLVEDPSGGVGSRTGSSGGSGGGGVAGSGGGGVAGSGGVGGGLLDSNDGDAASAMLLPLGLSPAQVQASAVAAESSTPDARVGLANALLVRANSLGASPSAIVPAAALYIGDDDPYDFVGPLSPLVPGTAAAVAEDGSGDGASDTRYDAST
jgi:hypothetical protein